MITHGPPHRRLDLTTRLQNVGCPHLFQAVKNARPLIHCFGHIHEASGAEIMHWPGYSGGELYIPPAVAEALVLDAWRRGVLGVEGVAETLTPLATVEMVKYLHAVEIDITQFSVAHIRRGHDTLLVNAAIMNAFNRPENPPCKQTLAINKVLIGTDRDVV